MNTQNKLVKILILSFSLFIFFQKPALAGTIKQVKNSKVLLSLDGDTAAVGDQLYGVNSANKKTSILEITNVKNGQAVAKILKGTAQPNDRTEAKAGATAATTNANAETASTTAKSSPSFIRHDMRKIAVNLKYINDSISSKQEDNTLPTARTEEVTMKGTNFGVNVSLDYPVKPWLYLRGYAGYETLVVKGAAGILGCDNRSSTDCNVNINYAALGAMVRLNYAFSSLEVWAGLGGGFKQPLTKKSTALKEDNIALANTAIVALGADYHLNNSYYIPASFEYHYSFNTSDTVPKINNMGFEIGFGFLF